LDGVRPSLVAAERLDSSFNDGSMFSSHDPLDQQEGARADDAHLDTILRVPTGEAVEAIEPQARVQVVEGALVVDGEGLGLAGEATMMK
jgi:hypothetical protein